MSAIQGNIKTETLVPELSSRDRWDADLYDKKATQQQVIATTILEELPLKGDEKRVLDVGCGDGKHTVAMAQAAKGAQVFGLDASEAMIAVARKKEKGDLHFHTKDIADCSLPSSLGRFDRIFSFNALHWVVDQEAALRNIYAMLEDHGTVTLQLFSPLANQGLISGNAAKLQASEKWAPYFKDWAPEPQMTVGSVDEYKALMEKVGFKDVKAEVRKFEFTQSREEMLQGLMTWLPYLEPLPAQKKEEFTSEFLDLILAATGQAGCDPAKVLLFPWLLQASR